ncbi:MAG: serine hydrolase [Deltaproteobacteria bacterium]|nr:serine hydrolase [Deltaproteobacteria bacterium]MBN2845277.1 serine hydrolase [Deltaproteobacteria bacterium]
MRHRLWQRLTVLVRFLLILFFTTGCILFPTGICFSGPNADYSYRIPPVIDDGWKTESLYKTTIDADKLIDLIRHIRNGDYKNIHGVLLVKDGKLMLEEYFHGFDREKPHQIRSATKSIGSILTGIAIDHRFIKDIKEKIYPYFKEYDIGQEWDARVRDVTLESLLTMTSGYACNDHATPKFECEKAMYGADDWVEYALNLPMAHKPGEHWAYNSSSLMLVSQIISKTSTMTIPDFAERYLFEPLGINEFHWGFSPKGRAWIAGNAKMKPRDMAKIGLLMLEGGKWKGKQIVSEKWIGESTREHEKSENNWGYGYLWWVGEQLIGEQIITGYWAAGNGGNYIFVCPGLDLVAVFTGGNYNSILELQTLGMLINYIIPAMLPPILPREIIKLDPAILDSCVGDYQLRQGDIRVSVFRKSDTLYCTILERTMRMYPETDDLFFIPDDILGNWTFKIERNEKGDVTSATGYTAFQAMPFQKLK